MLDDRQKDALREWYRRSEVLDEARRCVKNQYWEDLEEHIQMRSLLPLVRTSELPDYLRNEKGEALLPSVNPRDNKDAWEDAVGVGWEVVESELGLSHDDVHRAIAEQQKESWDTFMKSVEERKKQRGE